MIGKGLERLWESEDQEVCHEIISSKQDKKASPIYSQQNMVALSVAMPDDMPVWMGEISRSPTLSEDLQAINDSWEKESFLPRDELPNWLPNSKWSAPKSYICEQY